MKRNKRFEKEIHSYLLSNMNIDPSDYVHLLNYKKAKNDLIRQFNHKKLRIDDFLKTYNSNTSPNYVVLGKISTCHFYKWVLRHDASLNREEGI
jgi:hypothetical protein